MPSNYTKHLYTEPVKMVCTKGNDILRGPQAIRRSVLYEWSSTTVGFEANLSRPSLESARTPSNTTKPFTSGTPRTRNQRRLRCLSSKFLGRRHSVQQWQPRHDPNRTSHSPAVSRVHSLDTCPPCETTLHPCIPSLRLPTTALHGRHTLRRPFTLSLQPRLHSSNSSPRHETLDDNDDNVRRLQNFES